MKLHRGEPWRYMYRNFFPELRSASGGIKVEFFRPPALNLLPQGSGLDQVSLLDFVSSPQSPSVAPALFPGRPARSPLYLAVKTNMLYDAALVPNIGVEAYVGKNWSLAANWMYAWWKTDRHHRYWRIYGGDFEVRRWFGSAAMAKPLTGHHAGVYGQMLTYDFELGGKGYQAPKWSWAAGISYGYSLPVASRLNIDFTIGIGYMGGKYYEYRPIDNCYVWKSTHQRHYFGPTKAEVSLVWLIGYKNKNIKKGGDR